MALPPVDLFHSYIYGTAVWYFIRGMARTLQPETVFHWFEAHPTRSPTALELYNIRTDALGLLLSSVLLVCLSGVENPLSPPVRRDTNRLPKTAGPPVEFAWKRGAQLSIIATVAHHLSTAFLAYLQWADPRTRTGAMTLGWAFSSAISLLGVAAWFEVAAVDTSYEKAVRKKSLDLVATPSPQPRTPKVARSPKA